MQTIDFVVPMLFHDDEAWRRDYSHFLGEEMQPMDYYPQLRSWGTEELVVKGVVKFMPWIRTIHIILYGEGQVQPWMREYGDRIHIVYHRDFIPEEYLPCFNSFTIETFLGDIPGLTPMFIYGNDDIYPVAPMTPEDCFKDGKPCQSMHLRQFTRADSWNMFRCMCHNSFNLIASGFGQTYPDEFLGHYHGLSAIMRRTCVNVWKRHSEELKKRIFPGRTDMSICQYVYCYYQHLSGKYVDHVPATKVVSLVDGMEAVLEAVSNPELQVVCVNDSAVTNSTWQVVGRKLYEALEERINNTEA